MSLFDVKPECLVVPHVTVDDFKAALARAKPSVDKKQLKEYENFTQTFGQEG